nr:MAG TPA: replication initiator protein [Caudoviricetes sp.]
MFMLPEKLFEKPYNKISSDAKIIFMIHLQDLSNEEKYENLGSCKKYYNRPLRTSFNEIVNMTNLKSTDVHDAIFELRKIGLCTKDDFTWD